MVSQGGISRLRSKLRSMLGSLANWFLPSAEIAGFHVVLWTKEGELEPYLPKLREAIGLIEAHDARRFRRLQRDLDGFAIEEAGGDHFDEDLQLHVMDKVWFLRTPTLALAGRIVHEGTHARLFRRGFRWSRDCAARMEALSVAEEIAFLSRVPGSAALIEQRSCSLKKPWWGEADQEGRWVDRMRGRGVPEWLIKLRQRISAMFSI